MNKAQQPKWAIFLSVIPVILFFAVTLQLFYTDQSKPIYTFENLCSILIGTAGYLLIIIPYIIFKIKRKSYISLTAYIFILTFSVLEVFLFMHFQLSDILDNGNVFGITLPVNETMLFLLIPGCFYSLFGIVVLLNKTENKDAWRSLVFVIAIPIFYAFVFLIFSDININRLNFIPDIFIPIIIVVSVIFVVYHILRASYLSYNKNKSETFITSPPFIMVFGVFMPFLGLAVNNMDEVNYFGNFNSYWYFILAILNGVILAIPFGNNLTVRIIAFVVRSILFAFTLYFFIVFLPYTPLSVVLIAALGAGLLMLTPIVLFIIHCQVLINDIAFLKTYISKPYLRAILICSLLVIPVTIHQQLAANKKEMLSAIDYLDNPNYEKNPTINKRQTVNAFKVKQVYPGFLSGRQNKNGTPIISWYFNTVILDSKTISIAKGTALKCILLNSNPPTIINEPTTSDNVKLDHHLVTSSFDPAAGYWTSHVQLFLQAPDSTNQGWNNQLEYYSVFDLPSGCYITDYYLMIGDTKEKGILAEKKAAIWTYDRIVNTRKDPGFLHYITGERIALQIFPFAKNEMRESGITFIHAEPQTIMLDDDTIYLGQQTVSPINTIIESNNQVAYIPESVKVTLPKTQSQPYYHFIIDLSENNKQFNFEGAINEFIKKYPEGANNAKVSLVNYNISTFPYTEETKEKIKSASFNGGFFMDRAIRTAIFEKYMHPDETFPMFIVCSDDLEKAYINSDFSDMQFAYPDVDYFINLRSNRDIYKHNLFHFPYRADSSSHVLPVINPVYIYEDNKYPKQFLSTKPGSDIAIDFKNYNYETFEPGKNNWKNGLYFQAENRYLQLYPYLANKSWDESVYNSFTTGILTPVTSFISLENEGQKKMLREKQKEILEGTKAENMGEDPQMMSEPNVFLILIAGLVILGISKRKKILSKIF